MLRDTTSTRFFTLQRYYLEPSKIPEEDPTEIGKNKTLKVLYK